MRIRATIEIDYEVDPSRYSFYRSDNKNQRILNFERNIFMFADRIRTPLVEDTNQIKVIKIEEIK